MKREPLFYPICQQVALDHLAELPARLRASTAQANRIALGELHSGDQYIQVQLVVTSRPEDLLDDDCVMGDEE